MPGLKTLGKNSKVDITVEKWQKNLLLGQGETGVTEEGDQAASARAQEVVRRTRELLNSQGWCLWKCSTLGGEVILVVVDELVGGVPGGYPVYTVSELEELCQDGVSGAALRLVHEAKKLAGR